VSTGAFSPYKELKAIEAQESNRDTNSVVALFVSLHACVFKRVDERIPVASPVLKKLNEDFATSFIRIYGHLQNGNGAEVPDGWVHALTYVRRYPAKRISGITKLFTEHLYGDLRRLLADSEITLLEYVSVMDEISHCLGEREPNWKDDFWLEFSLELSKAFGSVSPAQFMRYHVYWLAQQDKKKPKPKG
jgi:hypothetical protein